MSLRTFDQKQREVFQEKECHRFYKDKNIVEDMKRRSTRDNLFGGFNHQQEIFKRQSVKVSEPKFNELSAQQRKHMEQMDHFGNKKCQSNNKKSQNDIVAFTDKWSDLKYQQKYTSQVIDPKERKNQFFLGQKVTDQKTRIIDKRFQSQGMKRARKSQQRASTSRQENLNQIQVSKENDFYHDQKDKQIQFEKTNTLSYAKRIKKLREEQGLFTEPNKIEWQSEKKVSFQPSTIQRGEFQRYKKSKMEEEKIVNEYKITDYPQNFDLVDLKKFCATQKVHLFDFQSKNDGKDINQQHIKIRSSKQNFENIEKLFKDNKISLQKVQENHQVKMNVVNLQNKIDSWNKALNKNIEKPKKQNKPVKNFTN